MTSNLDTKLRLMNDSSPEEHGWWHWKAWVEGPEPDLERVQAVTYLLHPTFTPHKQTVSERSTKFALESSAYGEFLLAADVELKDGEHLRLERWLELGPSSSTRGDGQPSRAPREPRVFISGSLADARLVEDLSAALAQRGVTVSTHDSFDEGGALQAELKRALQSVDAVVPIFSNPVSRWVHAEADAAVKLGRQLMPIRVANAEVPSFDKHFDQFQIKETNALTSALADTIAGRVKDLITPEEE